MANKKNYVTADTDVRSENKDLFSERAVVLVSGRREAAPGR
jgi:hypothetical protein